MLCSPRIAFSDWTQIDVGEDEEKSALFTFRAPVQPPILLTSSRYQPLASILNKHTAQTLQGRLCEGLSRTSVYLHGCSTLQSWLETCPPGAIHPIHAYICHAPVASQQRIPRQNPEANSRHTLRYHWLTNPSRTLHSS